MTRPARRWRWLVGVIVSAAVGVPMAAAAITSEPPPFDVFSAGTDAYSLHLRGAVPLEAVNARPGHATGYTDASPTSRGLAAVVDPGFLVGAALEGQGTELPGTANTGYPVGEPEDDASLTEPLALGPFTVATGTARSSSDDRGNSRQDVHYSGFGSDLASAEGGSGTATIGMAGDAYASTALGTLQGLALGPLVIQSIRAEAEATAPGPGGRARARVRLVIEGASVAGTPVVIDERGVRVADGDATGAASQEEVDQALASSGLSVKVPAARTVESSDGERAEAEVWGPVVDLQPQGSPARIGVSLAYAKATATARVFDRAPSVERAALPLLGPLSGTDAAALADPSGAVPGLGQAGPPLGSEGSEVSPVTPTPQEVVAAGRLAGSNAADRDWMPPIYSALSALLVLAALALPIGRLMERTMR